MSKWEELILESLVNPAPVSMASLAKRIGVRKVDLTEYREALRLLVRKRRLVQHRPGWIRLPMKDGELIGVVRRTSSGKGFFLPYSKDPDAQDKVPARGDQDQIAISASDLRDAQNGDIVIVSLLGKGRGPKKGRVIKVVERATQSFVGTYFERSKRGYVQIDGRQFQEPVSVGDPGAKGAKSGDKVVIEMLRFPTAIQLGEAVVTEVLGKRGAPGVDTLIVIREYGLHDGFPAPVLEEARLVAKKFREDDLRGRRDLTGWTIATIDPADARDFDDAISLTLDEKGHWHLGVHIADVSAFVVRGSQLDEEAKKRGTSVYLPDRVLPMLPELISNGLASLQEQKLRYTVTAALEFDPQGVLVHADFYRSAIKTIKRFSYEQVMEFLSSERKPADSVEELLLKMRQLAAILRRRRFQRGALELTLPEVKLLFDEQGRVSGASVVPYDESHQLIEEFMLAANIAVATSLKDVGLEYLRRVHGDPDIRKMRVFGEFVAGLGYPMKNVQSRSELQKLLDRVRELPIRQAINFALLRSFRQAEYSQHEVGHYALSAENYCHFTSPIRRYPDLVVHRQLIAHLERSKRNQKVPQIGELARHCSATERKADQAERLLIQLKLLACMSERIGEEISAVITGVQEFGLFCQGVELPIDGFLHVSKLPGDFYDFDRAGMSLVPRRKGPSYRLGDTIRVVISEVDVDRRDLLFSLPGKSRTRRN